MATVGVGSEAIDIKRAGIFPIVHGIRTMSLDRGIMITATTGRIEALAEAGAFDPEFGRELIGVLCVHGIPAADASKRCGASRCTGRH